MFQGPGEAKRVWFKEHETCRKMTPKNLQKGNEKFFDFLQLKALVMVETMDCLLFISKARVPPPCELQEDTTLCKHEGEIILCKQQQGDALPC